MQRFNVDADRIDVQYCWPNTMHFSLFGHIALMPDETDAKLPLGELEETTATPLYYMDEDYPAGPEIQQPVPE